MAGLFFELRYSVRELGLPHNGSGYIFDYGGPHGVKVVVRHPSQEEQAKGHKITNAFCTASSFVEPNENVWNTFTKIAANEMAPANSTGVSTEYLTPEGLRIRIPALSEFPEPFRSFITNVKEELRDFASRTISALRWRANVLGPHNPMSLSGPWGLYWSVNQDFWHPAPPSGIHLTIMSFEPVHMSEQLRREIEEMVITGKWEPLHHDLFREAWEQRHTNPRSAVVIGMAAAELAVKHCISTLVPDAEWLATNLPTPPLVRILKHYFPTLPARYNIEGKVKSPPRAVLRSLDKGVTIRNQLSHAGGSTPSASDVEEILKAVRDVLWLADYYSGTQWAFDFLRPETRAALSAP